MLSLKSLSKTFESGFHALGPLDFETGEVRTLALVGPSGCGKSTLLRLVAGLEKPSEGEILLDGLALDDEADIGVVFQEPRLLPWKTVAQNVAFGIRHLPRQQRRAVVDDRLGQVGLSGKGHLLPRELSGGMAQRVGIARALARSPRLLLLDEPFSALDPLTRIAMQDHLVSLLDEVKMRVLLVTHDMDEALALCDCIVVLEGPPARIRHVMTVDLPRPRARTSHAFQQYKETLMNEVMPHRASARAVSAEAA